MATFDELSVGLVPAGARLAAHQEIGRGLRIPVNQDGKRVFDDSINKLFVMANESYEDFARALQTEYEEECGVTFGKVPLSAIAKLIQVVDDEPMAIGREAADQIKQALVEQKMLDGDGKLLTAFTPKKPDFKIELPEALKDLEAPLIDLLSAYQIERHIKKEKDEGPTKLRKEVLLSPEFQALWDKIKPRTTYRVEFSTDELVIRAVSGIKKMPKIEPPTIRVVTGQLKVGRGEVKGTATGVAEEKLDYSNRPLPDILAYLQNETELTRSTLVRIVTQCERLNEFFVDPQKFMDSVATILKYELHRLLVDGIKYEPLTSGPLHDREWEQMLFKNEELINYLSALEVQKSLYEHVVYESEIERKFAQKLNERDDIKLFVKLPHWFLIDTPVGKYNPDWAIVKHDDATIYLVRETKDTKDFLRLRTAEADKVRCGQKHFDSLGVSFNVSVTADDL